jgi:hypothetical protein
MLRWHGTHNLDERPAALDDARAATELATAQTRATATNRHRAATLAEQTHARAAGRAALNGPGHAAARAEVARLARRAIERRTTAAAAETAAIDAAIRRARETHPE